MREANRKRPPTVWYLVLLHFALLCSFLFFLRIEKIVATLYWVHPLAPFFHFPSFSSFFLSFFFFFFFIHFRAASVAHGGSQARWWIGAIAAGLHHRHSNTRSELHLQPTPQLNTWSLIHRARPGIEPTFPWMLVRFVSTEPQWELPYFLFLSYFANSLNFSNIVINIFVVVIFDHPSFLITIAKNDASLKAPLNVSNF